MSDSTEERVRDAHPRETCGDHLPGFGRGVGSRGSRFLPGTGMSSAVAQDHCCWQLDAAQVGGGA